MGDVTIDVRDYGIVEQSTPTQEFYTQDGEERRVMIVFPAYTRLFTAVVKGEKHQEWSIVDATAGEAAAEAHHQATMKWFRQSLEAMK
jgi:hypothetical protein